MDSLTFEQLPQAIVALTNEVAMLRETILKNHKPTQTKTLIEIDDACKVVHKAKSTVYRLVRERKIPCYKVGNKLYFYECELLDWVTKNRRADIDATMDDLKLNISTGIRRKPKRPFSL